MLATCKSEETERPLFLYHKIRWNSTTREWRSLHDSGRIAARQPCDIITLYNSAAALSSSYSTSWKGLLQSSAEEKSCVQKTKGGCCVHLERKNKHRAKDFVLGFRIVSQECNCSVLPNSVCELCVRLVQFLPFSFRGGVQLYPCLLPSGLSMLLCI